MGIECRFAVVELVEETDAIVQKAISLLSYHSHKEETLVLSLTEDFKSVTIYVLEQGGLYSVPSFDYYSNRVLLPTRNQFSKFASAPDRPVILLIDSTAFPVSLFVETDGNTHKDSSGGTGISALAIGLIVGISWLCIFVVGGIILWLCCKRRMKPTQVQIIPTEPTRLQLPLKPSPGVVEELDAKFPVGRFASLKQPFCLSCLVCLETFTLASEVRTLTCKHTFHRHCLETLFSKRKRCCVCQRDYDTSAPGVDASTLEITSEAQHISGVSQTGFLNE